MLIYEYKIALGNSDLPKLLQRLDSSDKRTWRLLRYSTTGGRLAALLERVKARDELD